MSRQATTIAAALAGAYAVRGTDSLEAMLSSANDIASAEYTNLTDALSALIAGYGAGEEFYRSPGTGMFYTPIMETPANVAITGSWFQNCAELVELTVGRYDVPFTNTFQNNPKLRAIAFPNTTIYTGYGSTNTLFKSCSNLTQIRLGSIGHPVTSIDFGIPQLGAFELTIYCTDPEDITFGYSPIRADTTVIYRDSTTGEVIEL